ncbi:MAG: hypothetical protein AB1546_16450 [bacterium]
MKTQTATTLLISVGILIFTGCGGGGGSGAVNNGGDAVNPVVNMTVPAPNSSVSDVDFQSEAFYIQFSYNDASPIATGTLSVTMKMDNGAAQDITSYFSQTDSSSIKSSNLYNYTRTLFLLQANDTSRTITINATIQDSAQNTGTASASFTVYPVGPDIGPPD